MQVQLTDKELLVRLKNTEDNFVERKLFSDSSEWLKVAVSFANSAPAGYPCILFIGVKDDGTPEDKDENLEAIQRTFSKKLNNAFPPIYYVTKVLSHKGKEFLAVVIPGSPDRPHFSGHAYIRDGSDSNPASRAQFDNLIAMRNSKAYEIIKWKGRPVSLTYIFTGRAYDTEGEVADCNQWYVTVREGDTGNLASLPLEQTTLSFDHSAKRLRLEFARPWVR